MIFAIGPAIVTATVPPQRRGWALGLVSLAVALGLTLGPPLGGFLTTQFGWASIFLINVPLAAIVAPLALRVLPKDCPALHELRRAGGRSRRGIAASRCSWRCPWPTGFATTWPLIVTALVTGIVLAVLLVVHERRRADPMIDMHLLGSRGFGLPVLAALLAFTALSSAIFAMPFYLTQVRGLQEQDAGIVLTSLPLAMALLSPVFGRLSDSWGSRGLATGGMLVLAAGMGVLSFAGLAMPIPVIAAGLFVAGLGIAMFQSPNTSEILGATPRDRLGVGSAIVGEARTVGQSVGIAMAAAVLGFAAVPVTSAAPLTRSEALAFANAMGVAFWAAAGIAAIGALLSWRSSG